MALPIVAALDGVGVLLGGVAAIIGSVGTLLLGLLAYRKGQAGRATEADAWRLLAEARAVEIERLRAQVGGGGG